MSDAELDAAITEAARLLAASSFPVLAGLGTDVAGAISAFRLAKLLRGAVDHQAAASSLSEQTTLQDSGLMFVSPGEARRRADTFLLVGDRPLQAWPDLPDFLFAEAPSDPSEETPPRRIIALSSKEPDPRPAGNEISWFRWRPDELPAQLGALRARVNKRPLAQDFDRTDIDRIAGILGGAKYGVALWSPGELDSLATEMLAALIKDLNADTRWAGLSVAEDVSAVGAGMVSGWMTGFPLRTGFGRGYPEHDPWQFDARRLVASGEADAIVWISAFGEAPPEWLADVPTIILSDQFAPPAGAPSVGVTVGRPGLDHDAIIYDRRTGTLVEIAAAAPRQVPSVAEALDRIAARLST